MVGSLKCAISTALSLVDVLSNGIYRGFGASDGLAKGAQSWYIGPLPCPMHYIALSMLLAGQRNAY